MNVNSITFGIEIEATIPASSPIQVGGHGRGLPVAGIDGWKADADPSIHAAPGRRACEFVSPIYRGAEGVRQMIADIAKLKAAGATVNSSCGLHIHVGFDRSNSVAVQKLTALVANFEKAIFASTGTKRRERGRWTRGIQTYGAPATAINASRQNRYHVVNLGSEHPTVEFRAFGASLNPQKILAYVRMCIGLVERALTAKRVTNWTAKPVAESSPIHRSGEGQTALTRLFYQLGWTKGRQSHVHGDLAGDDLPTIHRSKRELIRLARKYDAQP